jgi:hypothetical protein
MQFWTEGPKGGPPAASTTHAPPERCSLKPDARAAAAALALLHASTKQQQPENRENPKQELTRRMEVAADGAHAVAADGAHARANALLSRSRTVSVVNYV